MSKGGASKACLLAVGCLLLPPVFSGSATASEIYFIDAHSQVDHEVTDLGLILERMKEAGVSRTILAARSGRRPEEVADFAAKSGGRIVPAVRTKSEAYYRGNRRYFNQVSQQVASGKFTAMAEILLYHARKGNKAPEVSVEPADERVKFALDRAIEQGWPFVIHIEFESLDRSGRQRFMTEMEKLLAAHPAHPFPLNHLGQLDAAEVKRLIGAHGNIYFLTAHANPAITRLSRQPWRNMFDGDRLAPEWKELMARHPDRFIFALDNVWETHWREHYLDQVAYWRKAVADLPPAVARAFAHGNAERLWKLPAER
ncbi:MAG TPA: amidohydrolase family protein [Burkholderiales bacterium]|nr:amidohydrolase family protein [Burkholderiales bacterium]HSD99129.1 amidohydrolase family protein [Burkholderiales bacterium]